jgi:hypothetical protein
VPWPWSSPRVRGDPGSANGASSFHLSWVGTGDDLVEVAATLEVLVPPSVDRLYFWALQVSFLDGRAHRGAAHIGLQANRNHPGGRAVNWGGYAAAGGLLAGTPSPLPSAPDDVNTRDYPWEPGRPYRFRVFRAPGAPGHWRGEVTDVASGRSAVVRDLLAGGDRMGSPMVWSEVFARCEHPSVTVRWSDLAATTAAGHVVVPRRLAVNYEAHANGGCDNTTSVGDARGVLQITNTERTVRQGSVIDLG